MTNAPGSQISVITLDGRKLVLYPVPMKRLPSQSGAEWSKFVGKVSELPMTNLSEQSEIELLKFMAEHDTEALTDGTCNCTLLGAVLVECFPDKIV